VPLTTRYGFAEAPTSAIVGDGSLAWTTSTGALAAAGTTLEVAASSAFPAALEFDIIIGVRDPATGVWASAENRHVTVVSGTTWTVSAGSLEHVSGSDIAHALTATALKHNPGALTDPGDLPYLLATGRMGRLAAPADGAYAVTWASGVPSWTPAPATSGIAFADLATPPGGTALGSVLAPFASLVVTGYANPIVSAVATPSGGSTYAEYFVVAVFADGTTTGAIGDAFVEVFDGPAVLDLTHYIDVTWTAVADAISYRVYTDERDGTPSSVGLLATVSAPTTTWRDTGGAADGTVVYPRNTTGSVTIPSVLHVNAGSSDGFRIDGLLGARFVSCGHNSTLIGSSAGPADLLDTLDIVAVGAGALVNLGDGLDGNSYYNLAVGRQSLAGVTTGNVNLGIGNGAFGSVVSGSFNLGIGADVGNFTSGAALEPTTTGSYNIMIGSEAGFTAGSAQLNNTLVIGYQVRVSASNRAVIGDAAMTDAYFGSETGAATLHAAGYVLSGGGTLATQAWVGLQGYTTPGAVVTYVTGLGYTTLAAVAGVGYVPGTRTVNGHALSANVTVTAADLSLGSVENAAASGLYVPLTRTVNGHALSGNVSVTASDLSLGSVENTALSTWAGTANLTTLGAIGTGSWNATAIPVTKGGTGSAFFTVAGPTATRIYTFPDAAATIARTDAANTFTGVQTMTSPALTGPVTVTEVAGSSGLTVTGATQTTSQPALNITQGWNANLAFTAIRLNVTKTLTNNSALLIDLQVGAASKFSVNEFGNMTVASEIAAGTWFYSTSNGATVGASNYLGFGAANANGTADTIFRRDAADTMAQRRTTTAQKFRVYNTFTTVDTAGEWFDIDWRTTANTCILSTRKGSSTGTLRGLIVAADGTVPLGFYGATPITRAVLATGTSKTVDNVITALQNLGLVSQT